MKKIILTILILGLVSSLLLKSSESAELVDQLILVYVGTPEEYEFSTFTSTIKRINRTHQVINAVWTLNEPLDDDIWSEVDVYRQDHGGWHPFFKRIKDKMCTTWFEPEGIAYGVKKTFMSEIPDGCPLKPAVFNSSVTVPRYRKNWIPELQAIIPPMMPSADKWRVDVKYFNKKNKQLAIFRMEYRLINIFSSQ